MNEIMLEAFNDELEKIALIIPTAIGALYAEDPVRGAAGGALGGVAGGALGVLGGAGAAALPALAVAKRDPVLAAALLQAGLATGGYGGALYGGYRGGTYFGGKRKKRKPSKK